MAATTSNLTLTRGDTNTFDVVCAVNGTVYDLTGADLHLTAKNGIDDADADAVIELTLADGITVTDAEGGEVTLTFAPSTTSALPHGRRLWWDLQAIKGGAITTLFKGRIFISGDVTRATA